MSLFTRKDHVRATAGLAREADANAYVRQVVAEYRKTSPKKKISFMTTPDGSGGVDIEILIGDKNFEIDAAFETAVKARMTGISAKG